eukprot:scaffold5441_cov123-Phaeocystis_antarctica.AAC.1
MPPPSPPPPSPPPPSPPLPPPSPPSPAPPLSSLLKLSATATLSSTHSAHFPASNCVDGDLNNFCHSDASVLSDPSLTLDLGTAVQVAYVAVYNRRDCCQSRLGDYTVSYRIRSTDPWAVCAEATAAADALGPLLSECPHMARYVMILLPGSNPYKNGDPGRILNLAEVEVYSFPPPPPPAPPPCSTNLSMTCGSQGCFDIYQTGDHHHIVTSNSASSLTITYGKGDTLGAWHPNSPWTCTCTAASCAKLVGTFKCSADFYGSTSLEIGLSNGAYTFEPACVNPACMSLVVRTCASPSPPQPPAPPPL